MQWVLFFLGLCCYWNGCSDKVLSLPAAPKPKYQAAADRLSYVLQDPEQGGDILLASPKIDFNSFNPFVGNRWPAEGSERLHATLMFQPLDDEKNLYPYVAKDFQEDEQSLTFELREEAVFSDGSPVTADDVAAGFELLKKNGKSDFRDDYTDVGYEILSPAKIRFYAVDSGALSARKKFALGLMPVLKTQDLDQSDGLKKPITSGPYHVERFDKTREVHYLKKPDWWGESLWFNQGRYNFNRIGYLYIPNPEMSYQAFRKKTYTLRRELNPQWQQNRYDLPEIKEGLVQNLKVANYQSIKAGGIFFNARSPFTKSQCIRRTLRDSFNFQSQNQRLYQGYYGYKPSLFFDPKLDSGVLEATNNKGGFIECECMDVDRSTQKLVVVALIPAHKKILEPWQRALKKHNIELVIQMTSPGEYFKRMQTNNYDLIVMPQVTGQDWCAVAKNLERFLKRSIDNEKGQEKMDSFINDVCAAKTDADEKQALQALDRWAYEQALFIPMWFRPEIFYASWVPLKVPESLIGQSDIDHWSVKR